MKDTLNSSLLPHENKKITTALLICKKDNFFACELAEELNTFLEKKGVLTQRFIHDAAKYPMISATDIVFVLGGDGTLVSVARWLAGTNIPVVGINFGKVGFLAELGRDNWREGVENLLEGKMHVERCMSLSYSLMRQGEVFSMGEVVNDIVITRGKLARLASFTLSFNGVSFVNIRADGLIVATPIGSTGYAYSANGPLIHPAIAAYSVTTICPFLCTFPSLIQPADTLLEVKIGDADPDVHLTLDGQQAIALQTDDILQMHGKPNRLVFGEAGMASYFKRLGVAGFVTGVRE